MKRPSFQFYPGDWLEDIGLRASSLAARGLWADILCYMHQGEPYGHLRKNGQDIGPEQLARMVGAPRGRVVALLAELERHHVFSRDEAGTIFSRRQVRDEALRQIRAEGGPRAAENPRASRPGEARDGGKPINKEGAPEGAGQGGAEGGVGRNPPSSPSPTTPTTAAAAARDERPSEEPRGKVLLSREGRLKAIAEGNGYLDALERLKPGMDRSWEIRQHSKTGSGASVLTLEQAKDEHLLRTVHALRDTVERLQANAPGAATRGGLPAAGPWEKP